MNMSSGDRQFWSSGYHPPLPIRFEPDNGKLIVCEQVVRALPGRRYVCRGYYGDRPAFIKLFAMSRRARREWRAEQAGIAALHGAGIAAPEILYAGTLVHDGTRLVVYAVLPDAVSAQQCWEQGDECARRHLLADLVDLVARHHAAGLRQVDLHLLNFVYSEATLYTLDASDIRQSSRPLSRADSVAGLADLLALLPADYDRLVAEVYGSYWRGREREASSGEQASLLRQVVDKRRYKRRKYLEKIFRSCSAFAVSRHWRKFAVYDRAFEGEALRGLLYAPDRAAAMQQALLLKDGNTCTVSEIELDGRRLVCKRYNIKHPWHALNRALRPSRAARSWRNGHRLLSCGIPTARPVALREQRFGPIRRRAWLLVEKIEGETLADYVCHGERQAGEEFKAILQAFSRLLEKMVLERISHGDMKVSNFIYHDGTLYLLDLDSLRTHDDEATFARAFRRDLRRFFKNWEKSPETVVLFRQVLSRTCVKGYLPAESAAELVAE